MFSHNAFLFRIAFICAARELRALGIPILCSLWRYPPLHVLPGSLSALFARFHLSGFPTSCVFLFSCGPAGVLRYFTWCPSSGCNIVFSVLELQGVLLGSVVVLLGCQRFLCLCPLGSASTYHDPFWPSCGLFSRALPVTTLHDISGYAAQCTVFIIGVPLYWREPVSCIQLTSGCSERLLVFHFPARFLALVEFLWCTWRRFVVQRRHFVTEPFIFSLLFLASH